MVRKKVTSLCAALCLSIALILPVGAPASASGALSPDTIVTEENVNQVIEYLGLDPRNLEKADAFSDDSVTVTVGELQQALNQLKQAPKEVTSTENLEVTPTENLNEIAPSDFCSGLKMLYYTTNLGGSFELSYEVAANYSWNKFTSVNNATVEVIDNDQNPLTTFTIASKDVGAKVTSDGEKVELKAKVEVDSWISIGNMGLIKVTTTTVRTTKEWNTIQAGIPGCI
ncbi:MAG: hypothetical protein E7L01_15605 [Paenibacillus macerans]|uniref:Uncharacterized protein n=1 Tax=Paenibacillus macerans TaxID=44252 RepID=A0A090ZMS6_PAEMA|nr:hypothetical protein [Paenibacillus macerans]KFN11922.1 hypothetical protein DJ90_6550 [Paenibacillus macerans]MBS5911143.1 hypothetical protein [Paenibacillus macerans]MCY7562350.1 hypothetical protein [Paenibacillus macerans]MDU5945531.1 hypothetical protein [Paenibacillus macerans]MDU7474731.1 hypothetical protein [Paenibacillus macerans]